MARPRKIFRTYRDFAGKGKTLSDLTMHEVQECMADPELSYQQWDALRKHLHSRSGIGSPEQFFEGVQLEDEPPPVMKREPSQPKDKPRLVEVDGKLVDPAAMTSLQRTTLFGNDNKTSAGSAMSSADYRKFMSEVKG